MTLTAKDHFEAGDLPAAIDALNAEVKRHPTDTDKRGFLAEMLCFDGNLERADLMLDAIAKQDTGAAMGVALFRQAVRAEQARRQCFAEGRVPEFLGGPPPHLRLALEALVALRAGDAALAARLAEEAEAARPAVAGECDGAAFDDMRDIDDLTAGFFEVLTSTGKYYWVPMDRVDSIEFHKPERPRDLIWRRAHMLVSEGPEGEVFLPALYVPPGEVDTPTRLGRLTDWAGPEGGPVRGIGQRMYLIGEESVPIMQIGTITFARASA